MINEVLANDSKIAIPFLDDYETNLILKRVGRMLVFGCMCKTPYIDKSKGYNNAPLNSVL